MRTLSFALLALLAAPLFAQDTIVLLDGRTIEGVRVTTDGLLEIEYAEGTGRRAKTDTIESRKVSQVQFGSTSAGFRDALARRDEGELAQAATWFEDEAGDEANSDVLRATARVEAGDMWRLAGGLGQARAAYDTLLRDYPQSRHVPRARLGKARLLMETGDPGAAAAFEEFAGAADSGGWGQRWVDQGRLFQAAAKVVAGTDATSELEALKSDSDDASVQAACELWIGRVLLGKNNPSGAASHFETVIESRFDVDREVAAGAYNGRGRCLFAFAEAASDAADKEAYFRDAMFAFLRVVVSYRDVGNEQAHALFWAGQSFLNTSSLVNSPARGRGLLKECADRFPGSLWGQRAAAGG